MVLRGGLGEDEWRKKRRGGGEVGWEKLSWEGRQDYQETYRRRVHRAEARVLHDGHLLSAAGGRHGLSGRVFLLGHMRASVADLAVVRGCVACCLCFSCVKARSVGKMPEEYLMTVLLSSCSCRLCKTEKGANKYVPAWPDGWRSFSRFHQHDQRPVACLDTSSPHHRQDQSTFTHRTHIYTFTGSHCLQKAASKSSCPRQHSSPAPPVSPAGRAPCVSRAHHWWLCH